MTGATLTRRLDDAIGAAALRALPALCRAHHVARLDVFGSAGTERFDPARSDIDLLVEFADVPIARFAENWRHFEQALERLLGRRVELIDAASLENPYFRAEVLATRQMLYAHP